MSLDSPIPVILPAAWCRKHLTSAEQRAVAYAATGLSTKAIAAELDKSPITVRNQLERAMKKLGIASRYELLAALRAAQPVPAPVKENVDSFAYAI